ncbi:MAG: hypothetical protein AB1611_00530 [bacterium]
MKELLKAIKTHLQADDTLSYVRDGDISIISDENSIPAAGNFPAIVIKDGPIRNEQMLARNYLQHAEVRITVYQRILKPEESVMGTHGVLAVANDVVTSLIDQKLNLPGVQNVFPVSEDPSQLYGDKEEMIQKKTITFVFTRHRSW